MTGTTDHRPRPARDDHALRGAPHVPPPTDHGSTTMFRTGRLAAFLVIVVLVTAFAVLAGSALAEAFADLREVMP